MPPGRGRTTERSGQSLLVFSVQFSGRGKAAKACMWRADTPVRPWERGAPAPRNGPWQPASPNESLTTFKLRRNPTNQAAALHMTEMKAPPSAPGRISFGSVAARFRTAEIPVLRPPDGRSTITLTNNDDDDHDDGLPKQTLPRAGDCPVCWRRWGRWLSRGSCVCTGDVGAGLFKGGSRSGSSASFRRGG
jgi:hypothetical protein